MEERKLEERIRETLIDAYEEGNLDYPFARKYIEGELVQAILTAVAESEAEAFIKWGWGERCKTKDIDDFPETQSDPLASRCVNCEMWEHYDDFIAQLGKEER